MFYDFLNLIAPNTCAACNTLLLKKENIICSKCQFDIDSNIKNEKISDKLNAILNFRVPFKNAICLFEFENKGKVQNILHNIKYKGDKKIAFQLGKVMGEQYLQQNIKIDAVTFVPLHKTKEQVRGFNQSKIFAEGIASILKKPIVDTLTRIRYTETQTKMNKANRWENVKDAFVKKENVNIKGQHLLLVDDVITTGATSEACYLGLSAHAEFEISLVYLAIAS
jgi:ComF family protein